MLRPQNTLKPSTKLKPLPIDGMTPSLLSEGCGTGRAYVVYLAKNREIGVIRFDHCASISCVLEANSRYEVGFLYDLHHSPEWRALSPGNSINLGLSAPNATTWSDIKHFKIPFGMSTVNVFATGFDNQVMDAESQASGLEKCVADLRAHHAKLDQIAREFEDGFG